MLYRIPASLLIALDAILARLLERYRGPCRIPLEALNQLLTRIGRLGSRLTELQLARSKLSLGRLLLLLPRRRLELLLGLLLCLRALRLRQGRRGERRRPEESGCSQELHGVRP